MPDLPPERASQASQAEPYRAEKAKDCLDCYSSGNGHQDFSCREYPVQVRRAVLGRRGLGTGQTNVVSDAARMRSVDSITK